MVTIDLQIEIHAGIDRCFDLARSIEVHLLAERQSRERAVDGRQSGTLGLGDTVTFEAVHFGIRQRLTSRIVELERPGRFVDQMEKGAFKSLRHTHCFTSSQPNTTTMRDILVFEAPLGPLGLLAEGLFLRRYMTAFMRRHQIEFRTIVEEQELG